MWRRWIYALRARLRALVRPKRSDHELNDEIISRGDGDAGQPGARHERR